VSHPVPTAGEFVGREHLLPVRVYYEDTDFSGVVYHANYLRFFERGRSDFLRLASTGHAELLDRDDPLAFVATRVEIDFLKPARIDDALVVRTTFDRAKGPRLFVSQAIERGGEVICRAKVDVAVVGLHGRPDVRPRRWPRASGPGWRPIRPERPFPPLFWRAACNRRRRTG
jgi:acyl-CoA thioester hydrolase